MMNEAQKNSVRSLEYLYSTVVGLGLSLAVVVTLDPGKPGGVVRWEAVSLFVSYLVTLIPFYHGALRHLDSTYVERGGQPIRPGLLLLDFVMLFIESCLLFALALLLTSPVSFVFGFAALLAFDGFWALLAYVVFTRKAGDGAELRWLLINVAAVAALIAYFLVVGVRPTEAPGADLPHKWFLLALALVRTVVDYAACWRYYFPAE